MTCRSIGKDGKPAKGRPLTDAELAHITTLVKDAVGFDQARGDSVNVVNASFRNDAAARRHRAGKGPDVGDPAVPRHGEARRRRDRAAGAGACGAAAR